MIAMMYFTFTTLATVGYGDFTPISNAELIVGSIILLFGVTLFSFVMGNFIEMLVQFKSVTAENEDNGALNKWLGLLARFNKGINLPKELHGQITDYFDYSWANDRNYASQSDIGKRFLNELPKSIIIDVSYRSVLIL